ncbi:MAG: DUF2911 domain-containing protein [Gemmatimonadota bacterium]
MRSQLLIALAAAAALTTQARAQQTTFVYRLGRDTTAIEQFTRTGNRITGETVNRSGAAVTRLQYEVTLGSDGRPTAVVYRTRNAAGATLPNAPTEIRLTFVGDSVRREAVFADSTSRRTLAAVRGTPFMGPAYGLLEIAFGQMRRANQQTAAFALVGTGAGNPGPMQFTVTGDTIRSPDGRKFVVDREGRIQSIDALSTTQKLTATRGSNRVDIATIAGGMRAMGLLSPRDNTHFSFMQSPVFINYSRPSVRERTVWGGTLVPFDQIWRNGANEATHLATSRELTFGNVVVPPGLYTLWIYNDRTAGPQLAINKQIGQWGAALPMTNVYNQANDVGRVPMTMAATPSHVEEYTITIRPAGAGRGAIDFAWGDKVATAAFTFR